MLVQHKHVTVQTRLIFSCNHGSHVPYRVSQLCV
jgi:hypothetical protein